MNKTKSNAIKISLSKPKKINYLSNAELLRCLEESHKANKMTDELATKLLLLVNKIGSSYKFNKYLFLDEMKGDALYLLCRNWSKFKSDKSSNPFSFFTQVVINEFRYKLNKEKKVRETKDALMRQAGLNGSWEFEEKAEEE